MLYVGVICASDRGLWQLLYATGTDSQQYIGTAYFLLHCIYVIQSYAMSFGIIFSCNQ